ncbi:translation initiation factor IF-2 [Arsenophonus symbiont of Ornithomya chloropus]|uniref:translation initiation factor IF-2 n=1 Tax=Arsenophonus symbiont of Ornithomya chloropus TaxID=634121 RepID=UPI0032B2F8EB
MTDKTVKSLAAEIQTSVEWLIQKFAVAGIKKTENDVVTQKEKEHLLAYLNHEDGTINNQTGKLILQRKTRSTLSITGIGGKSKSVNIEVRKKRTYLDRDLLVINHIEEKVNDETEKKIKFETTKKEKIKENKNNKKISKFHQDSMFVISKKKKFEIQTVTPKRKNEQEIKNKVEADSQLVTEEVCHIAEENPTYRNSNDVHYHENCHFISYRHAHVVEDENDIPEEGRRTRHRGNKVARQKKNYKHSEKAAREEERVVVRTSKNKVKQKKSSILQQSFTKPITVINRDVVIGETISVFELANKMAIKGSEVVKKMMKMGLMVTINQVLEQEIAQLVAEEMGHKVILRRENELEESILQNRNNFGVTIKESRAPIVTIMGHVDHGKTSLLDCIRSTQVTSEEIGGITQHIGAYHVKTDKGIITFLDTPGHAAFTAMRARGAKITDIIVLVVAVDDGVMPQTIEAIQHAKAANVPVVVVLNKIDKNEGDIENIKHELSKYGILTEEWGGENQFVNVSVKKGIGINELLEAILLQAELLELTAVHTGMASGVVIEAYLDKGRGPVATILVQEGKLNKGDIVLCGFEYGRIRGMRNELGIDVNTAGPSMPVEILGLSNIPSAGDKITVVTNEKKAREVALYRQSKIREVKLANQQKSKLEKMFDNIEDSKISELNIVLKTDVQGSCEAISNTLEKLSNDEVKVKIIGSGVGGITETDATLASASNAMIIGFNVRADASAKKIIEIENLELRYYSIIYNLIDEIKEAMFGMLTPKYQQKIIGLAEIRNVFKSPTCLSIAGCMVLEGIIKRNNLIRVLRNNIVIYEGELESLRRFKDDVHEVRNGMECGIVIKNYNDVRLGDIIESFEVIPVKSFIKD